MSIKVLSASAGSGKTFNISMFYIHKVLQNAQNFEKILALTFTNAAVNEMKNRILTKLYEISTGNTKVIEEYKNYCFAEKLNQSYNDEQIKINATKALQTIVFRYYNFSIYTIDSFLQKILGNCLIELGFRTNNKLIVETDKVIDEVTDEFLYIRKVEKQVLDWIKSFALHKISGSKDINLKNELTKLVKEINKEFFFFHKANFENKELNVYDNIAKNLKQTQEDFVKEVKSILQKFELLCRKYNIEYTDFKGGSKGIGNVFFNNFKNFRKGNELKSIKTKTLLNLINDEDAEWFSRDKKNKLGNSSLFEDLNNLHIEITNLFEDKATLYETARIIEDNIYNIGLIHKIIQLLEEYKKEHSIIFLSDIAQLLTDFIRENYLFIYEKLGVKYEFILIDEFQDTSHLQYLVLKPLIDESISHNSAETKALIVGDVKQAIYRWRNGDWELMSKQLKKDYKEQLKKQSLEYNWRSCPNIINFNNLLIEHLIQIETIKKPIENNFDDFLQKYPENKDKSNFNGYVKVVLEQANDNDDSDEDYIKDENWFIEDLNKLIQNNYKQIGILVRSNIEARKVFNLLIQSENYTNKLPVISKESITYGNSLLVEWLMYLIHYLHTQSSMSLYFVEKYLKNLAEKEDEENKNFIQKIIGNIKENQPLSLYLMVEFLLKEMFEYANINETEKIFALNFLQKLTNYLEKNDNNEVGFIDWYFSEGRNKTIVLTSKKEGIFIETIHSSKGLEYDAVIIPYVNWPKKNNSEYMWEENNVLESNNLPLLLIESKKDLLDTFFKETYEINKNKNKVDDLNILYVALTRAKKVLIFRVYNSGVGKDLLTVLNDNAFLSNQIEVDVKTVTVESCKKSKSVIEIGTLQELKEQEKEAKQENEISIVWNQADIFNASLVVQKNDELSTNKSIAYGNLLHKIMERLDNIDAWENIAEKVFYESNVTEIDKEKIKELLNKIIAKETYLYNLYKNAEHIISEQTIISNNKKYRPDKVFILKDKVVVVDFKTGEADIHNYLPQLKKYKMLLEHIGYSNVEACVFNIDKNEMEKV